MNRRLSAVGVLVIAGLVFLWIRSSSSPSDGKTVKSAREGRQEDVRRPQPPRRMAGRADDPAVPQRFSGGGRKGLKTYVRDDGSIVRDHRGGTSEPNLTSRESQPRDSSKVQPATLRSVRLALRPAMKKCIQEHAADADGAPKAQAVLTVSIKDELLRVDKLDFQSEGLAPEAEEHLKNCATTAMIGHEQPIGGSPEVAEHVMIFPYDL